MAQIRKLQGGNIINKVPAGKYFSVGDILYDFNKFLNLVWHNFDSWIESNNYNSKVKSETKKFINIVLDLLNRGVAKVNSDLSIMIEDPDGIWDNRAGFNKKGLFRDDKIDDNRGIPHIAMNYLLTILKSPYMIKKPLPSGVSSLTDPVIKNIIKLDFNSNSTRFANSDFGFLSHQQYDRVGMFKKALENYRDTTDFSIYDLESLKVIKDNIDNALDLIKNTTEFNDDFFKKISSYGFYGLDKYLSKSADLLQKEEIEKALKQELDKNLSDLEIYTNKLNEEINKELGEISGTGNNLIATRKYSKNDYLRFAAPEIDRAVNYYYSIIPQNWKLVIDWKLNNRLSFWTPHLINEPLQSISPDIYLDMIEDVMKEKKISRAEATNLGKALSRQLTRFLLGRNTLNFNTTNKAALEDNVKVVMSMASARNGFTPLYGSYFVLPDSYDAETKAYVAFDSATNTLLAVPEIFVKKSIWEPITQKVNAEMQKSKTGKYMKYSTNDIMRASLKLFLRNVNYGNGTSIFNDILKFKLPSNKNGGILKALTGAEITLRILNDTSGLYSEEVKAFNRGYDAGGSNEAERIRALASLERQRRESKRQQVLDVRSAKSEAERERKKQDFLDNESLVITSWEDLASNLTTHDKLVVGTLLADLVALGGSISGGAFNPVTDAAVLLSTLGTVGAIYTDDSLSPLAKWGYGIAGVGLNILGLIPEAGAAAGMYKLANTARKALPILSKVIKYGSIGLTGINALGPLLKLASGENLTKGEWKNLAYFTEALILGKISSKGVKEFKKYTTPVKAGTKYEVKTKTGRSIQVNRDVYEKLDGAKIKTLKENYGKPETALKDVHGNDINIENLSTKGTFSKLKGDGTVKGKVTTTSEGIRLKSLEEMHTEFGVPKITINGRTTYQVPKSYVNLARRLGQEPLVVVDDAGAESIVKLNTKTTTEPTEETKVLEETKVKAEGETNNKSPKASESKEQVNNNGASNSTSNNTSGSAPSAGGKVLSTSEKLELLITESSKKITKLDNDVKDFVKFLVSSRYNKNPDLNYSDRRILSLLRKVLQFKDATHGKLPSKYMEPGTTYYVRENGTFNKLNKNNSLKVGNKTFKTVQDKNWNFKHIFKFGWGGMFDLLKNVDSDIPRSNSEKALSFGKSLLYSPDLRYAAAALNSKRFYDYQRRKQALEPYTTEEIPNTIRYTTSDYYGAKSEANKTIGANNTISGRTYTSNLNDYLGLKYNTSIVANNAILDNLNTTQSTKRDAELKELDTKLEALLEKLRASAFNNRKAYNSWLTNQLNYDIMHEQNVSGLRQQWLDDKVKDAVDLKKSKILHDMVLGLSLLKLTGPFAKAVGKIDEDMNTLMNAHGGSRAAWQAEIDAGDSKAIDDFKKYNDLFKRKTNISNIRQLYDEDYMYNVSLGNLDIYPALKELLKYFEVEDSPSGTTADLATNTYVQRNGGTLSYELRMSLKNLDSLKERQKFLYKIALENKKQQNAEDKQRRKDFNEALRLLNKKSTMLLKASLQI